MFPYSEERFTADEEAILRRYVTNLDQPVFALVNLPEVVKGALFARYSRSPKSLRRLFLDEFVGDLDVSGDATVDATVGLARAEQLYEKVFVEYGDDSVAQLGGVHLACEQSSNVLSKVLEWGRLMAYLEQSTRYIAYNQRLENGQYRYYRPPEILDSRTAPATSGEMDRVFDTYGALLPRMQAWVAERFPQQAGDSDFVYRQATRAKSLDALRGLLPAASLSNIGIYGTGQSYEQLLLRMRAHPLPEARHYADMMLTELRKVIPSFLQRVDVPERGGEWSAYLPRPASDTAAVVARLWPDLGDPTARRVDAGGGRREVTLLDFDPDGEEKVLVAACFSHLGCSEREAADRVRRLGHDDRVALLPAYVGDRRNRRHRPGRAFERTDYRFELVTDYGAFRDLQRHRMLTIEWQRLGDLARLRHARPRRRRRTRRALRRGHRPRRGSLPLAAARLPRAGLLRRRAGAPHPLRHAIQRARGDAPHRAALGDRRAIRPTGGWPSRCTGPSPRSPGTGRWPRRCPSSTTGRPTSSASNRSAGPSAGGRKNLQRIDQEVPLFSLVAAP